VQSHYASTDSNDYSRLNNGELLRGYHKQLIQAESDPIEIQKYRDALTSRDISIEQLDTIFATVPVIENTTSSTVNGVLQYHIHTH
jgi:hypothetical protein